MEFVIKIYGAPYGFDLYEGSEQDLNYFQVFDNGSTEPVKMTVHRLSNNQISYNYLRYGYVTSGGRTGSFFGMSVVFNKCYCSDFMRMYQLFEAVYGTITKNAVLLEELKSGQWQAKYKIGKFSEAEDEIRRIYGVLGQNIQGALANDIKLMAFPTSVSGDKELRLSANVGNELVAKAVDRYSIVTISPAYAPGEKVVEKIPVEELMRFQSEKEAVLANATEWSNRVSAFTIKIQAHIANKLDVKSLLPKYNSIIEELEGSIVKIEKFMAMVQKCHSIEPLNPRFNKEVQEKISTAKDNANTLLESLRLYKGNFEDNKGSDGRVSGGGSDISDPGKNGPSNLEKFIHENKNKIIAAGVALLLIVGGVVAFDIKKGDNPADPPVPVQPDDPKEEPEIPELVLNVDSLSRSALNKFEKKDFVGAYFDYKNAGNMDAAAECQEAQKSKCLAEAKKKQKETDAIYYFTSEMAKVEYEVTESDKSKITNALKQTTVSSRQNSSSQVAKTNTVKKEIGGNVRIGDGNLGFNIVPFDKDFDLKFIPNNESMNINDIDVVWYIDDKQVGTGKVCRCKIAKAGAHKAKCTVSGKPFGPYTFTVKSNM